MFRRDKKNKREGWTWEDYAIEQLEQSLKHLEKGTKYICTKKSYLADIHLEASKIHLEAADAFMGDFTKVRTVIKDLFINN